MPTLAVTNASSAATRNGSLIVFDDVDSGLDRVADVLEVLVTTTNWSLENRASIAIGPARSEPGPRPARSARHRRVPQGLGHQLDPVDLDEQHGEREAQRSARTSAALELGGHQRPVGEPGERIVGGQVLDSSSNAFCSVRSRMTA